MYSNFFWIWVLIKLPLIDDNWVVENWHGDGWGMVDLRKNRGDDVWSSWWSRWIKVGFCSVFWNIGVSIFLLHLWSIGVVRMDWDASWMGWWSFGKGARLLVGWRRRKGGVPGHGVSIWSSFQLDFDSRVLRVVEALFRGRVSMGDCQGWLQWSPMARGVGARAPCERWRLG